ncbi:ubiquitin fusion degradation protein 1 [Pelomyxa schiedti]|nr:ubiquitin fusion degradation protein 1 [Pelomyxa schiedti]
MAGRSSWSMTAAEWEAKLDAERAHADRLMAQSIMLDRELAARGEGGEDESSDEDEGPLDFELMANSYGFAGVTVAFEYSDKVIMPPQILALLASHRIAFPYVFEMTSIDRTHSVHCGVLEFTSPPDHVLLPSWLMKTLCISESEMVEFRHKVLPTGTEVTFRPMDENFSKIGNVKAELEHILSSFTTLTLGTTITCICNTTSTSESSDSSNPFELNVVGLKPTGAKAVVVVDTDLNVLLENTTPSISQPCEDSTTKEEEMHPNFIGEGNKQVLEASDLQDAVPCPFCHSAVPKPQFELHKMRCERLNTLCEKCGAIVKKVDEIAHALTHNSVTCKCGQQVESCQLSSHSATECPLRPDLCPFCNISVLVKDLPNHTKYCGSKTTNCELCHQSVLLQHMPWHIESGCLEGLATPPPPPKKSTATMRMLQDHMRYMDTFNQAHGLTCDPDSMRNRNRTRDIFDGVDDMPRNPRNNNAEQPPEWDFSGIEDEEAGGHQDLVECPLCGRILYISEVEHHIDTCGSRPPPSSSSASTTNNTSSCASSSSTTRLPPPPSAAATKSSTSTTSSSGGGTSRGVVYTCPLCDAAFPSPDAVMFHTESAHADDEGF